MACYSGTVTSAEYSSADRSSPITELYNPKAVITHAALLRQAFAHCGRFPTAASRRSLDRVSVPVWPFILSDRLLIVGLVGRYLTNYLIRRKPLFRINPDNARTFRITAAAGTELAGPYSYGTCNKPHVAHFIPV